MDVNPAVAFGAGFLGLWPFLIAYLVGRGSQANPGAVTVGTNTTNPNCEQARADFEARRQERCAARVAEAAAKAELDSVTSSFNAVTAAVVSFTVAAFAALALPWPANLIASLILWTIVTALLITQMYFLGKKIVAGDVWGAASAALKAANDAVLAARNAVIANCPPEIANQTLSLPDPCQS
jgi:hypothetical protein